MAHIDTAALKSANADSVLAATEANDAMDELESLYADMLNATSAFNTALEDAKTKFDVAERKISNERELADGLSKQAGAFPDPVPEPAAWPGAPVASKARK